MVFFRQLIIHQKCVCQNGGLQEVPCLKLNYPTRFACNEKNVAEMVKDCFRTSEVVAFHTLLTKGREIKD